MQRRNQQVNRRHIKITYLLTAPEPARGLKHCPSADTWQYDIRSEMELAAVLSWQSVIHPANNLEQKDRIRTSTGCRLQPIFKLTHLSRQAYIKTNETVWVLQLNALIHEDLDFKKW